MSPYIIIATIAVYLALLFAVAWVSGRRADNATFFTGNRRSPWWAVALGMIAAPMSGVTFVSVPGMVGTSGFAYLQMAMGFVCGYMVIAFVLVPSLPGRRYFCCAPYACDPQPHSGTAPNEASGKHTAHNKNTSAPRGLAFCLCLCRR